MCCARLPVESDMTCSGTGRRRRGVPERLVPAARWLGTLRGVTVLRGAAALRLAAGDAPAARARAVAARGAGRALAGVFLLVWLVFFFFLALTEYASQPFAKSLLDRLARIA